MAAPPPAFEQANKRARQQNTLPPQSHTIPRFPLPPPPLIHSLPHPPEPSTPHPPFPTAPNPLTHPASTLLHTHQASHTLPTFSPVFVLPVTAPESSCFSLSQFPSHPFFSVHPSFGLTLLHCTHSPFSLSPSLSLPFPSPTPLSPASLFRGLIL